MASLEEVLGVGSPMEQLDQHQQSIGAKAFRELVSLVDADTLFTSKSVRSKLIVMPTQAKAPLRMHEIDRVLIGGRIQSFFEQVHKQHGDAFQSAIIHGNYESCGNDELPKGVLVTMDADAELDSRLVSSRIGAGMYMVEIPQDQVSHKTLDHIRSKLDELNEAVPQDHRDAATLVNSIDGPDKEKWEATLGSAGNFVGAAYTEPARGTGRVFLRVRSDGGRAARQLKAFAHHKVLEARAAGGRYTFRDFANSKHYATTVDLSRRNAFRILAKVARLLGFVVLVREDSKAAVSSKHDIRPQMVYTPDIQNEFGHIYLAKAGGRDVAVIANQVVYTPKAVGGLCYSADSTYNSLVYNTPRSKTGCSLEMPLKNQYCQSFAPFTGKSRAPLSTASKTIGSDVAHFVERNVTWEGKARGHENARVMNRYAPVSDDIREANDRVLCAEHGVTELRPCICKIASDTPDYSHASAL